MHKKIKLILCLLFIVVVGGVTIWRSFEAMEEKKTNGEQGEPVKRNNEVAPSDAALTCQDSIVTIRCKHGGGNAVLLCEKEESYVLCTAGHVMQGLSGLKAEEMQLEVADTQAEVNTFWISDTYDVAFLEIARAKASAEGAFAGKQQTGLSDKGYMNLKEGDLLWAWSYYGGELVSTEVKVNSPWIYVEDFGYHMIWGSATDTKGGMSGSGVFDCEGHLTGILCGGNDAEVAVLPINIILGELKNSSIDISGY